MTYNEAKPKVLNHLEVLGWRTDKFLKVPTAQKNVRGFTVTFFFKSQSIYFSATQDGTKDFKTARSLHDDLKFLAVTSPTLAEKKLLASVDCLTGLNLLNLNPWG